MLSLQYIYAFLSNDIMAKFAVQKKKHGEKKSVSLLSLHNEMHTDFHTTGPALKAFPHPMETRQSCSPTGINSVLPQTSTVAKRTQASQLFLW